MRYLWLALLALPLTTPLYAQTPPAACVHPSTTPEASIQACQTALAKAPSADARYNLGRLQLDAGQLEEAADTFDSFTQTYSKDPRAIYAADLHLDALHRSGRLEALERAARAYASGRPLSDPVFVARARDVVAGAIFKRCTQTPIDDERHLDCFLTFAREMPNHPEAPTALFNAAVALERRREPARAEQVYRHLLKTYPTSRLDALALSRAAILAHRRADLELAASRFEELADRYPKHDESPDALIQAGHIREAFGAWEQAIKNYESYLKRFGRKRDSERVLLHIAKVYETHGKVAQAQRAYTALSRRAKGALSLQGSLRALALTMPLRSQRARRDALKTLERLERAATGLGASPDLQELRAEIVFLRAKLEHARLTAGKPSRAELTTSIEGYKQTLMTRNLRWIMHAMLEMASLHEAISELKGRSCDVTCRSEARQSAIAIYKLILQRGQDLVYYESEWRRAQRALVRLGEERPNSEFTAQPRSSLGTQKPGLRWE